MLSLIYTGAAKLDGQDALDRAQRLLRELGVNSKLTLSTLQEGRSYRKEPNWTVGFTMPKGWVQVSLNAETGRPDALFIHLEPEPKQTSNRTPTAREVRRVRHVLKILGYDKNISAGSDVGFSGLAQYYVQVHGLPFFNMNPTYGPSLSMDFSSGLPAIFYPCPPLPPVNGWAPKIKSSDALAKLKSWGHARALKRGLPPEVDPSMGNVVAELGYWKPKDKPTALLVWRASKYTTIYGQRYGLGSLRMFVDALTGEFVEPDDPLWGANP